MVLHGGALPLLFCQVVSATGPAALEPARPRLAVVLDGDADAPPRLAADARAHVAAAFAEATSALVPAATVDKWVADARARSSSSCRGGLVSRDCRVSLGYVLEATYLARARITRAGGRCILALRVFELTRDLPVASYAGQGSCDATGLTTLARQAVARVGRVLRLPRASAGKRAPAAVDKGGIEPRPAVEPDDDEATPDAGPAEAPPADLEPGDATPGSAPPDDGAGG